MQRVSVERIGVSVDRINTSHLQFSGDTVILGSHCPRADRTSIQRVHPAIVPLPGHSRYLRLHAAIVQSHRFNNKPYDNRRGLTLSSNSHIASSGIFSYGL